jgi:chemotaxis protein MotA
MFYVGTVVVLGCVFGGYMMNGGHMHVLWQPFEFLIIMGAAVGGYIIGNPKPVLSATGGALGAMIRGPKYTKASYLELLTLLYSVFKMIRTKGMLSIEPHLENPHTSTLFEKFPVFIHDHHALIFFCDYLRLLTMNADNPMHMEALMEVELDTHHEEMNQIAAAVQTVGDGMPALGIVAAVLGVIHTMGSITEPPEVLGHLIGGALVGTFAGVLIAYGFVNPIAGAIKAVFDAESKYLLCIKAGFIAHLNGFAPALSIEFARKTILSHDRPTFDELEKACEALT